MATDTRSDLAFKTYAENLIDEKCIGTIEKTFWATRQRCGGPIPRLVLLTLADMSDQAGVWIEPHLRPLCLRTEMDEKNVHHALMALVGLGLIEYRQLWDGNRPDGFAVVLTLPEAL